MKNFKYDKIFLNSLKNNNIFYYIYHGEDIDFIVEKTINETIGDDLPDYLKMAEKDLLLSITHYLWSEAPYSEMNQFMVTELLSSGRANWSWNRESDLDLLFNYLKTKKPDHIALEIYERYKENAGSEIDKVIQSCLKRLGRFNMQTNIVSYIHSEGGFDDDLKGVWSLANTLVSNLNDEFFHGKDTRDAQLYYVAALICYLTDEKTDFALKIINREKNKFFKKTITPSIQFLADDEITERIKRLARREPNHPASELFNRFIYEAENNETKIIDDYKNKLKSLNFLNNDKADDDIFDFPDFDFPELPDFSELNFFD